MDSHLDKRSAELIDQTNRIGVSFLLADLSVGLTFLQMASATSSESTRTRYLGKAMEVHRTVVRLLPRLVATPDEQLEIEAKLSDLQGRLKSAGYPCGRIFL